MTKKRQKNLKIKRKELTKSTDWKGYDPKLFISWHIGKFINQTKWGVGKINKCIDVFQGLTKFEKMTYQELFKDNHSNNHHVNLKEINKHAYKWLEEEELLDNELWSIRVDSRTRIWGIIKERYIFSILWFDPNHEIFISKKKNT